jgi:hypothetical protein
LRSTVAILHIGRVHNRRDQQPYRVGDNMPLPAVRLLSRIVATRATGRGRSRRLAVDQHPGGRTGVTSGGFSCGHQQRVVDPLPLGAPGIEISLKGGERRKITWSIRGQPVWAI